MDYQEFLQSKITIASGSGFEVKEAELHPLNFPHQNDAIRWAGVSGAIFRRANHDTLRASLVIRTNHRR